MNFGKEKEKKKKRNIELIRTSRSFKVSIWDILEFRSQFEIRTCIFIITLDYGTLINKEIESISNNFDVLCWNSPRCCPRSSPDGWIRFLLYKTLKFTKCTKVWATKIFIKDKMTGKLK